jgi:secondary thiamine-phosphate synthase enzyme
MIYTATLSFRTKGFCDIVDITPDVKNVIERAGIPNGLMTVFCPGSTGAVTTVEYESGVLEDLREALEKIAPTDIPYRHNLRWHDGNGFSHVRAALMKPSLSIPLVGGTPTLGPWQQIVFIDFDNRERQRDLIVQIIGD